jgi:hypothetical protein
MQQQVPQPIKPWETEPNRVDFRSHGFPCIINRVEELGHLCGYVGVPAGHPWHGKHYVDVPADVHGGLTYSDKCNDAICHVPNPGESDDVWWLGFDCAHFGDLSPGLQKHFTRISGTYRDISFVTSECERLAAQALDVGEKQ